ncbi:unnamed protein product [Didymodactylos carnosus]|uniref:G-protein coupled receptors family 1 profile domain-containing protein n=1 Tax=Didymodactylos carnosus TaxID=1234261 RepID=A0A8S2QQG2_9BILA|nr:unnamed protein product [Didymodactylos carnosus]CAF4120074.1 unnamed protein product [Didymodactylos carnosus]
MTRVMIAQLILGVVGNLFNISIFLQKSLRSNSCSMYLITSSITNVFVLNFGIIPSLYTLDHVNPSNYSLVYCKLRLYLIHGPLMISRWCIVLACIDRWALCSSHTKVREFSRSVVAGRLIPIIVSLWLIIPLHIPIFNTIDSKQRCIMPGVYSLIYSLYALIVSGTIPPILMVLFSILTFSNLREIRKRVQPVGGGTQIKIKQRDIQLMVMLSAEVFVYIFSTVLYPINVFYTALTVNDSKTPLRTTIESFITFLAGSFLIYINSAAAFYVYLLTSKQFRQELKNILVIYCLKYLFKNKFRNYRQNQRTTGGGSLKTTYHEQSLSMSQRYI